MPVSCTPNDLVAAAVCQSDSIGFGPQLAIKTDLLCQWAQAAACVTPAIGDLGASNATDAVNFTLILPPPQPTVGVIIRWGTNAGGPYPNSKEFPVGGPYSVTTADGLVDGTTYYFVAFGDSGPGCLSAQSNESSGTPQAGAFSYAPNTQNINWIDMNGAHGPTNLAGFNATADKPTVTEVDMNGSGITSISNLQDLPALTLLDIGGNPGLAVVDASNLLNLTNISAGSCGLTDLNLSGDTSLTTVNCSTNVLTALNVTGCTALTTLDCSFNQLASITGLSNCTALTSFIANNNLFVTLNLNFMPADIADIDVSSNPNLTSVTTDNIGTAGNLVFSFTAITAVSLPLLTSLTGGLLIQTCPNLTSISVPNLTLTGSSCSVQGNASLATVSFPSLQFVGGAFNVTGCAILTSISAPNLTNGGSGGSGFASNPLLTSVDLSSLVTTADIDFNGDASLVTLSFPALATPGAIYIYNCTALTGFSAANITTVSSGGIDLHGCTVLTSFSLPALTTVGAINSNGCTLLTSISFASLTTKSSAISCQNCPALTTVNLGTATFADDGSTIDFSADALNQASVDAILARGVASAVATLDFELTGGTNAQPSACTDVNTLRTAGNTVNVNGPC